MDERSSKWNSTIPLRLGSWWMYLDEQPDGAVTIFKVTAQQATPKHDSVIEVWFYSLNGTTNNKEYVNRQIPDVLSPLTGSAFIEMLSTGVLVPIQIGTILTLSRTDDGVVVEVRK